MTELAKPFEMTQPAISKHLKVLERAGLISRGRGAQARPPASKRAASRRPRIGWSPWEESFDRLDAYLDELKRKEKPDARGK